ncbi:hypothetical protein I4F81_001880 [Pyropia yezoensis]|uniref:Uncharacterized protein n=1 Tax=Pyropia yezoensis TaxID=2788 RepID=A0ACC3BMZ2_PYRYE|nr:hypothetical protein I4F81_001880 [Neopyropia yezoensis]
MSATEFILHEELRMASGEVASVVGVQQAAGVFRDLASGVAMGDDTRAGGGAVAKPPPPPSSPPLTSVQAERLALCLAVRGAGRHWRLGLLTAAVADLPPGQVAATFCDGDDTPTVSLAIGAEAVLASHGRVAARIGCLGLGDAWAVWWQLAHPDATVDGCAAWIRTHYGGEYA